MKRLLTLVVLLALAFFAAGGEAKAGGFGFSFGNGGFNRGFNRGGFFGFNRGFNGFNRFNRFNRFNGFGANYGVGVGAGCGVNGFSGFGRPPVIVQDQFGNTFAY